MATKMHDRFLIIDQAGKKEPSAMTLIRIPEALEVSPRDFFPESEEGEGVDVKSEIKNEIMELLARL